MPDNLQTFVEALRVVDVFSANHLEIASIVGKDIPETVDLPFFEDLCAPLLEDGKYGHSTWVPGIVIRAGDQGCFVKSSSGHQTWLPAYYIPDDEGKEPSKVVDTTGAGNTFLGAFTIGLLMAPDDYIFAACAGNVGASFAVEQVGVPTLSSSEDGEEFWNGESVSARLQAYRDRVGSC